MLPVFELSLSLGVCSSQNCQLTVSEVKDMVSHVGLFLEVFTRGDKDEGGRPVLDLLAFNDFVQFFFTVKSTFSKFARNGSIHLYSGLGSVTHQKTETSWRTTFNCTNTASTLEL